MILLFWYKKTGQASIQEAFTQISTYYALYDYIYNQFQYLHLKISSLGVLGFWIPDCRPSASDILIRNIVKRHMKKEGDVIEES